ncbi:MAG: 2'-5' RNA ligase family protein [Candidatus Aminicenantales bacterium]
MSKRAIVIFPKFEELHLLRQLRRQFDPLANTIEPHMTLVFPFESHLSAEHLQTHIQQAVQGVGPFPVQLHGIIGSEGEYLFLNVKRGNDRLIELHDRLYSGALAAYLSVEHTFIPHLTVGRLGNKAAFLSALEEARKIRTIFQTVIEEVAVYRVDGERPIEFCVRL